MNKVIIFGTTQFAELLYFNLKKDKEYEVVAFTVDGAFKKYDRFCELPVIDFEDITTIYNPERYGMFICVGYSKMNMIRKEKFLKAKEKGYRIINYIHPTALIQTKFIGEGNIFMEGVIIGPFVKIGNGNIFYPKAHIAHHTSLGNFNFIAISAAIAGNVLIADNCFFGNNCTTRNDIIIQKFTLVGAASYLSCSTDSEGLVYVPPRSVKLPNKSSFEINLITKLNNGN